jgi:hypothetical protein
MLIPKTHPLLEKTIEEGVIYGYRRAHKHTDEPTESEICTAISDAVMLQISEAFDFIDSNGQRESWS